MHVVGTNGTVFEEYCKGFLKEKRDWNYLLKCITTEVVSTF